MKIAIVHPILSFGGASAVAIWTIMALKKNHDLTLITTEDINFSELNAFFGCDIKPTELDVRKISYLLGPALDGFLAKIALTQRYYKRHMKEFNLAIATRCEMDLGKPGIQYIHCPIWNDKILRQLGQLPEGWQYRKGIPRSLYKLLCKYISGFDEARMKENITLVNSNWMGELVKDAYGIESRTIYPPVKKDFPLIPWEEREEGFVCLGAVSPGKRIEDIIAIVGLVRYSIPLVHLHIIGRASDPIYTKKIRQLCGENYDWLFWEGQLPREQLANLIAKHKYGIHGMPNEHFGIAVAEMANAGCIIFVPNSGGQVEIVKDERLLYANLNEAESKILDIMCHEETQAEIQEQLHEQSQQYSVQKFMESIKEIIE